MHLWMAVFFLYQSLSPVTQFQSKLVDTHQDTVLLQLNARVEGHHPDDITDDQIQQWKIMGFNTLYLMGIWEESPYSKMYNQYWGLKDNEGVKGYDNQYRVASAFSMIDYRVNPDLGGESSILKLRQRLQNQGMKLMLDFVPNHMAMDNVYLWQHPEYFMHEDVTGDEVSQNLSEHFLDFVPSHWPTHSNGKIRYKIWHAKDFDAYQPKDYFLFQELDDRGHEVQVLKFYFGNKEWRDTVQINLAHPLARRFMMNQLLRVAQLMGDGGVRWDFVHVTLQKEFLSRWYRSTPGVQDINDWYSFLRVWSGVDHLPRREAEWWNRQLAQWVRDQTILIEKIKQSDQSDLDQFNILIQMFQQYVNAHLDEKYPSIAVAFQFEGVKELFYAQVSQHLDWNQYIQITEQSERVTFKQFSQELIEKLRMIYPDIFHVAEAYEERVYLTWLGFSSIYSSPFFDILIKDIYEGKSFAESIDNFFDWLRNKKYGNWSLEQQVLYLENFDDGPALALLANHSDDPFNELILKSLLIFGLPGTKFLDWSLINGNMTRLGANWVGTQIDPVISPQINDFFKRFVPWISHPVIIFGKNSLLNLTNGLLGYKRAYQGQEIVVIMNNSESEQKIHLSEIFPENLQKHVKILVSSSDQVLIEGEWLVLAPGQGAWISPSFSQLSINEIELAA